MLRSRLAALAALSLLAAACASTPDPTTTTTTTLHDHSNPDPGEGREWDGEGSPTIQLSLSGDNAEGWMGTVEVSNFVIDGAATTEHIPGHGHVHVLVDGREWSMIYSPTFTIPHLEPGVHTVSVTLTSNDHLDYMIAGQIIMAMATIEVPGELDRPDVLIRVEIYDDQVSVDPPKPEASLGDVIEVTVVSDTDELLHVHGYDVTVTVGPDEPASLLFTAAIPGIFEVELEHSGTHIFELTVE